MTDHIDVPIIVTGDWIDAAWINLYIGDNVRAWRQAYTTAGAMAYAVDFNTLAELPITNGGIPYGLTNRPFWLASPAGSGILTHPGGAAAPAWLGIGGAGNSLVVNPGGTGYEWRKPVGIIDVSGMAERTDTSALTNTIWADITGLSVTLALTRQCTIYGRLDGDIAADGAGSSSISIRVVIDGVAMTTGLEATFSDNNVQIPFPVSWRRTGIAAGSRIVKIQGIRNAGANYYVRGALHAWAVVE